MLADVWAGCVADCEVLLLLDVLDDSIDPGPLMSVSVVPEDEEEEVCSALVELVVPKPVVVVGCDEIGVLALDSPVSVWDVVEDSGLFGPSVLLVVVCSWDGPEVLEAPSLVLLPEVEALVDSVVDTTVVGEPVDELPEGLLDIDVFSPELSPLVWLLDTPDEEDSMDPGPFTFEVEETSPDVDVMGVELVELVGVP